MAVKNGKFAEERERVKSLAKCRAGGDDSWGKGHKGQTIALIAVGGKRWGG